jgi:hypothetical protein
MLKQIIIGLFTLTLVAILWTEADAQTCLRWRSIAGSKTCVSWTTGSEVCNTVSTGVGGINQCDPDLGTCPVITCSAFGTVDVGLGCNPNILDPNCGITGIAFCTNKPGNARNAEGRPFTLETSLTLTEAIETCSKNGKCLNSIELNPEDTGDFCINPNWHFLTFTASEFNAEVVVCPGGYDASPTPQCCDDNQRNLDGTCSVPGIEVSLAQRCTVDLTGYRPGDARPYDCQDLP